ncbi:adenylate/guanylate cyclase domain-containing protein [Nonomuraea endophytica]|uniref:Adenylate cyclase n=1 Tax=Nonomuraea endophytica TaxID=714136 RepID=A0A7W7ZXQ7_9ACTN|nr:adenylate/guanylate cyclase domain-containing protein [Nonomuraea endophytica]MBB5074823.1 adenylate cyclase [Nonomuraea endophytica]
METPGRPTAEEIERLLVGTPARYTRAEVAAKSGVSQELAERIWRALGFATLSDDAVAFSDADVAALGRVRTMLDSGLLDEQTVLRMTRALGRTTARLAQWQAEIMVGAMLPKDTEASDSELAAVLETAQNLLPDFEHVLVHVWRAQLAAAGTRMLALADTSDETETAKVNIAVGFADLVSFTRRARDLDERQLAALVEGFEARAADVVAAHGARLVKTLGDEVLFSAPSAEVAARIALDLVEADELRIGLAYGPVLQMMGDVFGTTVNLAARLTAIARPGTIVVDAGLAAELAGQPGLDVLRIRRRPARGLGVVQPYVLRRSSS